MHIWVQKYFYILSFIGNDDRSNFVDDFLKKPLFWVFWSPYFLNTLNVSHYRLSLLSRCRETLSGGPAALTPFLLSPPHHPRLVTRLGCLCFDLVVVAFAPSPLPCLWTEEEMMAQ